MNAKVLITLSALFIFGLVNMQIVQKEDLRRNGQAIFLELAPVDPRSLMQGDYMALDFAISRSIAENLPKSGRPVKQVVLKLNTQRRASFSRFDTSAQPATNEILLNFTLRNGRPWLGTNAFFFEEGSASRYEGARFGEFRVNSMGDAILVNLYKTLP